MSTTPEELAQGAGAGGDAGNSPPDLTAQLQEELEKVKKENAELREERRTSRAKELGHAHQLDDATVELLSKLPADQMEEHAAKIAEARGQQQQQPATPPAGDGTPQGMSPASGTGDEPANAAALEAMRRSGGDGTGEGEQLTLAQQMQAEINGAQSAHELEAIQQKYHRIAQETGDPTILVM